VCVPAHVQPTLFLMPRARRAAGVEPSHGRSARPSRWPAPETSSSIDAGWRWWWNRISGGQQVIEHRLAALWLPRTTVRRAGRHRARPPARRGAGLFLQVVAKLLLDLVGFEIPRETLEQALIAAERPGRQPPGLRREVLKPSAPFSRL
jgi:hypothetical protein